MFKTGRQFRSPDPEAAGGGGDGGALGSRRGNKGGEGGGNTVTAADARTFLADFAPDPAALATLKDEDAIAYHGRVTGALTKRQSEALAAAALKFDQRPDWLPEPFFDPEKKTLRPDAVVKAWKDTRAELDRVKGANGKRPETAEAYAFERPKDLPAHVLPDPAKDAGLKLLREVAFETGLTQEQFTKFSTEFFTRAGKIMPAPLDPKAEIAKLGDNGEKVADTVITWAEGLGKAGLLSEAEVDAIVEVGQTATGIRALNKLREHMGGQAIPVKSAEGEALPSKDELYKLVADDRYTGKGGKGDPAFRAKVSEQFKKVFGEDAAGTSERGHI